MSQPTTGDANRQNLLGLVSGLDVSIADTLNQALGGEDISVEQAIELFATTGPEFNAVQF